MARSKFVWTVINEELEQKIVFAQTIEQIGRVLDLETIIAINRIDLCSYYSDYLDHADVIDIPFVD